MRDFDKHIDRSHTEATKWERHRKEFSENEFIPLWLADMDLPCSEAIENALVTRASHPIYGYTDRNAMYLDLFANRFNQHYDYKLIKEDVVLSTGVMYSITCAIRLFSKPHDNIVVLTPCYHPFICAIENSDRNVLRCAMNRVDGCFTIDFIDLEEKLKQSSILLLCNPHNPTGRVFTTEELMKIALLCETYQITVICDEIHCDITYPNHKFQPFMQMNTYTKEHTITCVSPTKSFNIAGIKVSAVFIKNKQWKLQFEKEASTIGINSINLFAMEALKAAYLHSEEWQYNLMQYLDKNREYIAVFLKDKLPNVQYSEVEGTYFYWLDFSNYVHGKQFYDVFKQKAHVICSPGIEFDEKYTSWLRLNFACTRKAIEDALHRIYACLQEEEYI